jgi:hypothetical protein
MTAIGCVRTHAGAKVAATTVAGLLIAIEVIGRLIVLSLIVQP